MKSLQTLLLLCMLVTCTSHAQNSEYSFKEEYQMSLPAQLTISTSDGNIEVVSSRRSSIEVFYIARRNNKVLNITREALEKELTLEVIHEKDQLKIAVRYHNANWSFFSMDRIDVDFRIHAPRQTLSTLNTSDGDISLAGLEGHQQCKTSDGDVRLENISGDVTARTSDGDLSIKKAEGSIQITTSDGDIEVSDVIGDVMASTSDGDITISRVEGNISTKTSDGHIAFKDLAGSFTATTSDGNIRGNLIRLSEQLTVRTGDGNIDITIPDRMGLDLHINAESIHVPLTNFSGRSEEKSIRGKSNGGGIPVKLSASDGNVNLVYR